MIPISVIRYQTSVISTSVPYIHQTCTICQPDMYLTICTPDDHQTYTRHPPNICQVYGMSGVNGVLVWQMSGEASVCWGIWQASDREHQTNSNCLAETVVYRIKTAPPIDNVLILIRILVTVSICKGLRKIMQKLFWYDWPWYLDYNSPISR